MLGVAANGPAIWGGCVTRREHRAGSWYFSQLVVTVQGGYGACFCRPGTNFIEHYACRVTSLIGARKLSRYRIFVGGTGAVSRRAPQKRSESGGTNCLGARKLSRCRISITCRCACPGATAITNLSWEQEHLPAGRQESKKCDKQLTHIVRVISWPFLSFLISH
jgi:hypothetical protein